MYFVSDAYSSSINRKLAAIETMIHRLFVLCILCTFSALLLRCSNALSAVSDLLVTDSQEISMGQNVHAQIQQSNDYPLYAEKSGHNRALVRYVDSLGQLLADAQRDRRGLPFHFTIIDNDEQVNAFAVPGGYVYIYTGLIKEIIAKDSLSAEAMLAGVIAHEIVHITMRHGVQAMVQNNLQDLLLDLIVGDSTAVRAALDVAGGLGALKYSRVHEYEADSKGVDYLADAGINPRGMQKMLSMLASMGSGAHLELFSTHPATKDRVDEVKSIIDRSYSSEATIPEKPIPYQQGDI